MTSQNPIEDEAVPKKTNEIRVRLAVWGFSCHPDEITRILGLTPTDIWLAGRPMPGPPGSRELLYRDNGWMLNSPLYGSPEIEEQVDALIPVVAPHAERFRDLPDGICPVLDCAVYGYEYMPAIHFTADQIRFLTSIGAEIDVDVYDLTEADE